jgi:hypothetical protein
MTLKETIANIGHHLLIFVYMRQYNYFSHSTLRPSSILHTNSFHYYFAKADKILENNSSRKEKNIIGYVSSTKVL